MFVDATKDLRNEFYLTFDLGEIMQLTEFQITFNINQDMYNQPLGQLVRPQMVILEGKKETMFVTSKQKSQPSWVDAESEAGADKESEWQTADKGDWVQILDFISDSQDQ